MLFLHLQTKKCHSRNSCLSLELYLLCWESKMFLLVKFYLQRENNDTRIALGMKERYWTHQ